MNGIQQEIKDRHKREIDALNGILQSSTGIMWMPQEAHPIIRGYLADAHAKELFSHNEPHHIHTR